MTVEEMIRRVYEVLPGEQPVRMFKWQSRAEMDSKLAEMKANGDDAKNSLHILLNELYILYLDSAGDTFYPFGGGDMLKNEYDPDHDGKVIAAEQADAFVWASWQ